MTADTDTIVAPATPAGRGGIGIVRVSGPRAAELAGAIVSRVPKPRRATFARFLSGSGEPIDAGIALFFQGPESFTGEDVLELHGHGGPVVMDLLVRRALELGARLARPGEFTERAFLNGKIDLAQAEAVADLIGAGSEQAASAAMRSLQGEFSAAVGGLAEAILALRVYVEGALDFPDEEVEWLGSPQVAERLDDIMGRFAAIRAAAQQGRVLRDGLSVVIAGPPNAGKSSLLNALAGHDAAIVTDIPGTTRDVLREHIVLDGLPVHVIDTAGLREAADAIETEGVRRARAEIARADVVLYVMDITAPPTPATVQADLAALHSSGEVIGVWNKIDLAGGSDPSSSPRGLTPPGSDPSAPPGTALPLSAKTSAGLDALRACLRNAAGYRADGGALSARQRHLDALKRAEAHAAAAQERLEARESFELAAEELRLAHRALGEITGEVTSEALLGEIFSQFCIGK